MDEPGSASPAPAQADSARDLIALWVAFVGKPPHRRNRRRALDVTVTRAPDDWRAWDLTDLLSGPIGADHGRAGPAVHDPSNGRAHETVSE